MAITATNFALYRHLHAEGHLPQGGSVLEIGESNVYGDFDTKQIAALLPGVDCRGLDTFGWAKMMYRALFNTADITSVDLGGPSALKLDLNKPIELPRRFDVSINGGTAEHCFNIAQVFRTMHDWTKQGGLMIHGAPFAGWLDHGFYCLQPTLFWDLAEANGYTILLVAAEHMASRTVIHCDSRELLLELRRRDQLPGNLLLFVAMRKEKDTPFAIPTQGVYAGTVSDRVTQAWRELR